MSRRLGARSISISDIYGSGLYYQWGRKDPFPGPNRVDVGRPGKFNYMLGSNSRAVSGTSPTLGSVIEYRNLGNSIKNPTTYFTKRGGW